MTYAWNHSLLTILKISTGFKISEQVAMEIAKSLPASLLCGKYFLLPTGLFPKNSAYIERMWFFLFSLKLLLCHRKTTSSLEKLRGALLNFPRWQSDGFSKNYFANQNYQSFRMLIIIRFRSINIEMTEKRYHDKNYFFSCNCCKKDSIKKN